MRECVWLFPLMFIIHDMEEIVGFGWWLKKNKCMLAEKYPSVLRTYADFSTEGFAVAVYEELIICVAVCLGAAVTDSVWLWGIWLGGLIGCTLHFVIHIGQSIVVRQYIPALITSIIELPCGILVIVRCVPELITLSVSRIQEFSADMNIGNLIEENSDMAGKIAAIVLMVAGVMIVGINVKFAQRLIGWFTKLIEIS